MLRISLLTIAAAGSLLASAQLSVGLQGGITVSKGAFDDDDLDEAANAIVGYRFAVPVEASITENFAVQAELGLLQRGQRSEVSIDLGPWTLSGEGTTRLTYLDAAALGKAGLLDGDLTAAALAGPSLSYAVGGRNIDGDGRVEKIDWGDEGNTLRRIDFGFAFGAQAGMAIGPGRVVVDARYRFGLNDLTDDGDGAAVTVHSRAFSATLGYLVPI